MAIFAKISEISGNFFRGGQKSSKMMFFKCKQQCAQSVHGGSILDPGGLKMDPILGLFLALQNMLNPRENINFSVKKDPRLQKFAKICKF